MCKKIIILLVILSAPLLACQKEKELLRPFINAGDLVFDIGAHEGLKTDIYLSLGAGRVICVEPQPECILYLKNKYAGNKSVIIEEKGLAAKPGVLELAICMDANTISTLSQEWQNRGRFSQHGYKWDKKIKIKVDTLDSLISKYGVPHFCKIDVENFEYEVLKGLTHPIKYLSFEFAIEILHNTEKCLQRLVELGYTCFNFTTGAHCEFMLPKWVGAEDLLKEIRYAALYKNDDSWGLLMGDIYVRYE